MDNIKKFSKKDIFAKHCGCELVEVSKGRATAKLTLGKEHLNAAGVAHGGAIFTLADFAFAMASNSHGNLALAINVSVSFIKAVSSGVLTANVKEVSRNPKLATYSMVVTNDSGELIASLMGMVYRKKDKLGF